MQILHTNLINCVDITEIYYINFIIKACIYSNKLNGDCKFINNISTLSIYS